MFVDIFLRACSNVFYAESVAVESAFSLLCKYTLFWFRFRTNWLPFSSNWCWCDWTCTDVYTWRVESIALFHVIFLSACGDGFSTGCWHLFRQFYHAFELAKAKSKALQEDKILVFLLKLCMQRNDLKKLLRLQLSKKDDVSFAFYIYTSQFC